jgi:hypothetical protein
MDGLRWAIVEPVLGNIRTQKRRDRLTWRSRIKVNMQWLLYGRVHNIEKIVHYGIAASTESQDRLPQTRDQTESVLRWLAGFRHAGEPELGIGRLSWPNAKTARNEQKTPRAKPLFRQSQHRRAADCLTASAPLPLPGAAAASARVNMKKWGHFWPKCMIPSADFYFSAISDRGRRACAPFKNTTDPNREIGRIAHLLDLIDEMVDFQVVFHPLKRSTSPLTER